MSAAAGGAAADNSSSTMNDIVKLNVGGHTHVTTRATLCAEENSVLASMFRPEESKFAPPVVLRLDDDGAIFLDRNPLIFGHVLDYLRNGCRLVHDPPEEHLKLLRAEADFFGLEGLRGGCDDRLHQTNQARAQQPLTTVPPPLTRCRESHKKIVSSWDFHR